MTVVFGIAVSFVCFYGFPRCPFAWAVFVLVMGIGTYWTVKVKKYYNLLKENSRAPSGYSGINYQNNV